MSSYVYRVTHLPTGKHYVGSRKSTVEPHFDLGVVYFTSSSSFRRMFRNEPRSNFKVKIVSIHATYRQAYETEQRYLLRVGVPNEKFFNQTHFFGSFPLTDEAKLKQQVARLRLAQDLDWLRKNSQSHIGVAHPHKALFLGPHTLQVKQRISNSLKGIPKTLEHRQKLRESAKAYWNRRSSDAQSTPVTHG
jgi:hypothetical protein